MAGIGLIFVILFGIMLGPPIILVIIGLQKRKTDKDSAKIFYILAVSWIVIGGGICASLLN
jgi:hypothetical protein